ncbi:MAG TPA: hypothetical protein VGF69_01770 [Thermoanaerobaculia bacterium]|jgi:hypothetical protein
MAVEENDRLRDVEGDRVQHEKFKRAVQQTYELCRASAVPTQLKVEAYRMWAISEPDRKKAIRGLIDGIAEIDQRHGEDSPESLPLRLHLGLVVAAESREEGTAILDRALTIQRKHYGAVSEQVADGYMHLAVVAQVAEDFTLAEHHYRSAIDIARKACGPECRTLSTAIHALANIVKRDPRRAGEVEALMREWEEAIPKQPRRKRDEHP